MLDRAMINKLLRVLNRPEPSGYGTIPSENMNAAWYVSERSTEITLTKGYAPDRPKKEKEVDADEF